MTANIPYALPRYDRAASAAVTRLYSFVRLCRLPGPEFGARPCA